MSTRLLNRFRSIWGSGPPPAAAITDTSLAAPGIDRTVDVDEALSHMRQLIAELSSTADVIETHVQEQRRTTGDQPAVRDTGRARQP